MFDFAKQKTDNEYAVINPQPGDYWHEMFNPYFLVLHVKGDEITIFNFISKDPATNARINERDYWTIDYNKTMVVNRTWLESKVKYTGIPSFVADVWRSKKYDGIVSEWRDMKAQALRKEWEDFTGWTHLKEPHANEG